MSGKYSKRNKKKQKAGTPKVLWVLLVLSLLLCGTMITLAWRMDQPEEPEVYVPGENATATTEAAAASETELAPEDEYAFVLDENLSITRMGDYTGAYMEDGSDEIVSGVMMIVVTNQGEQTLQYTQITLNGEAGEAVFKLSTLKPGETAVVLEANRKEYHSGDAYTEAALSNTVYFAEPVSMYEDVIRLQPLDGGFNISNISDQDINGRIAVYYKDYTGGMYYGGITYRVSITEGMKAGEIKQIMSENFSSSGSAVVFLTITEE